MTPFAWSKPRLLPERSLTVSVMLLLVTTLPIANSECILSYSVLTVRFEDCLPQRVLTRACVGSCSSSVRPSQTRPGHLHRTCFSCETPQSQSRSIILMCPYNGDHERGFQRKSFGITVPGSCQCSPCSNDTLPVDSNRQDI